MGTIANRRRFGHIDAANGRSTRRGKFESGQNVECGRLAGPIHTLKINLEMHKVLLWIKNENERKFGKMDKKNSRIINHIEPSFTFLNGIRLKYYQMDLKN